MKLREYGLTNRILNQKYSFATPLVWKKHLYVPALATMLHNKDVMQFRVRYDHDISAYALNVSAIEHDMFEQINWADAIFRNQPSFHFSSTDDIRRGVIYWLYVFKPLPPLRIHIEAADALMKNGSKP